jgi:hypothetical protein
MLALIKYLMDENVDIAYCKQIRRRKPEGRMPYAPTETEFVPL